MVSDACLVLRVFLTHPLNPLNPTQAAHSTHSLNPFDPLSHTRYGRSGVGRELGLEGLFEFTELKSVIFSGFTAAEAGVTDVGECCGGHGHGASTSTDNQASSLLVPILIGAALGASVALALARRP